MNKKIKLSKNFTTEFNKLTEELGEEFELINGFHETQLNGTDFIDNFTADNKPVADTTIDANASVTTKDIQSLLKEKDKSENKLLAFNKIFYELQKEYGIKIAREWLAMEMGPFLYMHDAPTSTFFSYCYKGEEMITILYNNQIENVSFKELYNLIPEEYERFDNSIQQIAKFPKNLLVQDIDDKGNLTWTEIKRVVCHQNEKKMRFIKFANGLSQIVTEDHPIITNEGDIPAKDVTTENKCYTLKPNYFSLQKTDIQTELTEGQIKNKFFDGLGSFPLNKDFGWMTGMFLAEGSCSSDAVLIVQKEGPQLDKLIYLCNKYNLKYSLYGKDDDSTKTLYIKICPFSQWLKTTFKNQVCNTKKLPSDYIHYNSEFLDGIVAGIIDGDGAIDGYKHRHCQIRITSEQLCHQLSNYLSTKGIYCGDRTPYISKKRIGSFEQKLPIFGIGFTLTKEEYWLNIGSIKIETLYEPRVRKVGNFANKRYQYDYGWTNIIENSEYIENCPVVYDITTQSSHFICNNILSHNCFAYDLSRLATEGLFFIDNYNNEPPRHLQTFLDDVIEYISYMSNRSSGAVGIPDILIWMFYFWKHDVEQNYYLVSPEYYLKQAFQKLIYRLNQKFYRDQTQTVFSNMSIFDSVYLEALFGGREYPDGTFVIDYLDDIMKVQKMFMDTVSEIRSQNLFTYPVLTFSLIYRNGHFEDEEFARWASNHNRKWNDSNFFISENPGALSNCCRLISDTTQLDPFINSIGGTALSVGSVKVSTINLEAIAFEYPNNEDKFIEKLNRVQYIDMCALDRVRHIIQRNIEKKLLPNFIEGGVEMDKLFNTVGFLGLYEVMDIYGYIDEDEFGYKSYSDKGIAFAQKIFDALNKNKEAFCADRDYKINLESVPGESAAVKLAAKDRLYYAHPKCHEILSNQWIPLTEKCTIEEKARLSGLFDKRCGGGVIAHINIESEFPTEESAWDMLNYLASHNVIYFAFNSRINECANHHGFVGTKTCPECGGEVIDTYQRIVGYLVPTRSYSAARKKEFGKRQWYNIGNMIDTIG